METTKLDEKDCNPDPITGAPGAHPLGVGAGAAAGGTAGAAVGSAVGPIGTVVGAVVGALAGGLAGKAVAEGVDPTVSSEETARIDAVRTDLTARSVSGLESAEQIRLANEEHARMNSTLPPTNSTPTV